MWQRLLVVGGWRLEIVGFVAIRRIGSLQLEAYGGINNISSGSGNIILSTTNLDF